MLRWMTRATVREAWQARLYARSISFAPLVPGSMDPICCEWELPCGYHIPSPDAVAVVYDSRSGNLVGIADILPREGEFLLTLTSHRLSHDDRRVDDPADLRIVVTGKTP